MVRYIARDRPLQQLCRGGSSVTALGNGWLERVTSDAADGLTLYFGSQKVTLVGRNLATEMRPNVRLIDGLLRHRIPWIKNASEPEVLKAAADILVIEEISIE